MLRLGERKEVDDFRPGQAGGGASALGFMCGEVLYGVLLVAVDMDQIVEKCGQGIGFPIDRFWIQNPGSFVVLLGGLAEKGLNMIDHLGVGECAEIHQEDHVQAVEKTGDVASVASLGMLGILQPREAFDDFEHQQLVDADDLTFSD